MPDKPDQAQAVMNLQRYLRQLSYTDPTIPPPPVDGVCGEATRRSTAAFQKVHALPVTGTADRATWEALYAAYTQDVYDRCRPAPLYIFPASPAGLSLGVGDTGETIGIIQLLLRDLLVSYGMRAERLAVDGVFGRATEAAVRAFQTVCRLPKSGRVDKATWDLLAAEYGRLADGPCGE